MQDNITATYLDAAGNTLNVVRLTAPYAMRARWTRIIKDRLVVDAANGATLDCVDVYGDSGTVYADFTNVDGGAWVSIRIERSEDLHA